MSGLRVISDDGLVVEVPVAIETGSEAVREQYIAAQFAAQRANGDRDAPAGPGGVEDERNKAHGSGRGPREG